VVLIKKKRQFFKIKHKW